MPDSPRDRGAGGPADIGAVVITPGVRRRPVHLRPRYVVLVAAGGTLGTAAREGIALALPQQTGVAVLVINVAGAFLLGLLLDALVRRGPDEGVRRRLRLLLGTGFCGGFTTYSTLAVTTLLLGAGGILYAAATVVLGGAASFAGIACGALTRRRG